MELQAVLFVLAVLIGTCGSLHMGHRVMMSSTGDTELRKNAELYSAIGGSAATPANRRRLFKPEVLAPAGGWPQLKAAIANGADAVYFGLQEGFNARARASNFAIDEVPELMAYLHERGCKGYTVVNVLVFDEEMQRLEDVIKKLAKAGVDALIMQDIGAAKFARTVAPNLPVHGSTQMTITDANGAIFAEKRLGLDRVVVGRELSIAEIDSVSSNSGTEVEAFVHGALCVSYSGQCFSSEAWGGRSANRGQCAQACRLPYGLLVNGTLRDLQDVSYLLSPQDLMAVDMVPQLIRAGVRSFKIEGRLKGPEYVGVTTKAYRVAVDEAWGLLAGQEAESLPSPASVMAPLAGFRGIAPDLRQELKQVFSRGQDENFDGLSPGFLLGVQHQNLVRGRNPRHRGLLVGRVVSVPPKGGAIVELLGPIKRGEGVVFDAGSPEDDEEGGSVYEVFDSSGKNPTAKGESRTSGRALLTFGTNAVNFRRVRVGDLIWKSKDPALEARLRGETEAKGEQRLAVGARITGGPGQPLTVTLEPLRAQDDDHHDDDHEGAAVRGSGATEALLEPSRGNGISSADVVKALGHLGDSPFTLRPEDVDMSGVAGVEGLFIPLKEIKAARRLAVTDLQSKLRRHNRDQGVDRSGGSPMLSSLRARAVEQAAPVATASTSPQPAVDSSWEINVLCRTAAQAQAACSIPWLKEVTLDFLEVHGLREAVAFVQKAGKRAIVATPRIIKPDEEKLYTFYLRLRADAILVRSAGFLEQLSGLGGPGSILPHTNISIPELRGDFSLNAANLLSASILLEAGLSRLTPTHDLNAQQIADLSVLMGPAACAALEVIVYQHLPIFHTEHCVFCKFLSSGNSFRDCGHPCETNRVHLRGMDGQDNLVLADQGCRNTVFNAQAQVGAEFIPTLLDAGIRNYRIEFVDEPSEVVAPLLGLFREVAMAHAQGRNSAGAREKLELYVAKVRDSNGRIHGATPGSLKPTAENFKLKTTAAEQRARGGTAK